jgi:hypothetical protein
MPRRRQPEPPIYTFRVRILGGYYAPTSTTLAPSSTWCYFGVFKALWARANRIDERHYAGFWEVHHVTLPLAQGDARVVLARIIHEGGPTRYGRPFARWATYQIGTVAR